MTKKTNGFSKRYLTILRKHLKDGPRASLQPALKLGRQAVLRGMETLELARIHEQALVTLSVSHGENGRRKVAEIFFTEALSPIVETHRAARQSKSDLKRMNEVLGRRTTELASTNRQLQRGIVRRKRVESALKKSGVHYSKLLKSSLQLQEGLRQLTHRLLAAQEEERKKMSKELQDEISQTLLGINVRLLSLKQEARVNTKGLKKKIASTQQLVAESTVAARRAARKLSS
jgi:signal transduction histidine kinase